MGYLQVQANGDGDKSREQRDTEEDKGDYQELSQYSPYQGRHCCARNEKREERENHDGFLRNTLRTLQEKGITLRPDKCKLRKSEIKWFGYIFSKAGMSTDPDKCKVIKEWARNKSGKEVKSFLQTVQFNAKFLAGTDDQESYPALTEPLRNLTKKNATFVWGTTQQRSFDEIKKRLCSERVMTPYDTQRKTRIMLTPALQELRQR